VKNEHLQLCCKANGPARQCPGGRAVVTLIARSPAILFTAFFSCELGEFGSRERQHVGRLCSCPRKLAIQFADSFVCGEQDGRPDHAAARRPALDGEKSGDRACCAGAMGFAGALREEDAGTTVCFTEAGFGEGSVVQIWIKEDHRARSRKERGSESFLILREG
jgi:hypothetical protein